MKNFQHLSYDASPNLTHAEDVLKLRKSVDHHPSFREKGTYVMPIVTLEKKWKTFMKENYQLII